MSSCAVPVLLIDDKPAIAGAMRRWLSGVPAILWLECATDLARGCELSRDRRPRVVLLDLDLVIPHVRGAIEALTRDNPECRVVIFTGYASAALVDDALMAGAAGFITKDTEPSKILELILNAADGNVALCPTASWILRNPSD